MRAMLADRKPLDATAFGVMLLCTALWGFQQVAIKLAAQDVSFVMQAGIRSSVAAVLLFAWARARGIALFRRDGTLVPGIVAGLLFGAEFVFIYAGLGHTTASRMIVFIYLAPVATALGLHLFVRGERLVRGQWLGVLLSFGGVALAFAGGFSAGRDATFLGDLFGVIGALLWAATTVLVRGTRLAHVTATKTLLYQLAVSALMLPAASVLMGEKGVVALTPLALASLAYQGVVVAFASYLAWFWLLTRYLAARLSVFSFLTPLFGVLAGVLVLGEPLTPSFAWAGLLVGLGIVLVNLRRR
ncbi:MAG TPA: DMT family transporter [Burkholderiales bacterium]|nr:DMT family transporter [Burkholderiales bacterium]